VLSFAQKKCTYKLSVIQSLRTLQYSIRNDIRQAVIYCSRAILYITCDIRNNIALKLGVLTIIAVLVVSINICSVLMTLSIILGKKTVILTVIDNF